MTGLPEVKAVLGNSPVSNFCCLKEKEMFKIETGVKLKKNGFGTKGRATGPRTKLTKSIAALKENQSFFVPFPHSKSKKSVYANIGANATRMRERGVIDFKVKLRAERNDNGKDGVRVFHEKQRA
jgi:hypothetical protein